MSDLSPPIQKPPALSPFELTVLRAVPSQRAAPAVQIFEYVAEDSDREITPPYLAGTLTALERKGFVSSVGMTVPPVGGKAAPGVHWHRTEAGVQAVADADAKREREEIDQCKKG